jgi:Ca2+-transporting ATPase
LGKCSFILEGDREIRLTDNDRKELLDANERMASSALRILAMAYRTIPPEIAELNEGDR